MPVQSCTPHPGSRRPHPCKPFKQHLDTEQVTTRGEVLVEIMSPLFMASSGGNCTFTQKNEIFPNPPLTDAGCQIRRVRRVNIHNYMCECSKQTPTRDCQIRTMKYCPGFKWTYEHVTPGTDQGVVHEHSANIPLKSSPGEPDSQHWSSNTRTPKGTAGTKGTDPTCNHSRTKRCAAHEDKLL